MRAAVPRPRGIVAERRRALGDAPGPSRRCCARRSSQIVPADRRANTERPPPAASPHARLQTRPGSSISRLIRSASLNVCWRRADRAAGTSFWSRRHVASAAKASASRNGFERGGEARGARRPAVPATLRWSPMRRLRSPRARRGISRCQRSGNRSPFPVSMKPAGAPRRYAPSSSSRRTRPPRPVRVPLSCRSARRPDLARVRGADAEQLAVLGMAGARDQPRPWSWRGAIRCSRVVKAEGRRR